MISNKETRKNIGIPLHEVGVRLEKLNKILEEHGMAVGAKIQINQEHLNNKTVVLGADITVYFFADVKEEVNVEND